MREYRRTYKLSNFTIKVKDDKEVVLFDALKCGEDVPDNTVGSCIFISVYDKQTGKNAQYVHYFGKFVTYKSVDNYMQKFLTDEKVRKLCETCKVDVLKGLVMSPVKKQAVNPRCARQVAVLNSKSNDQLKFRDFAALKTYGRDSYSAMKFDKLQELINNPAVIKNVIEEFPKDVTYQTVTLRWVCRGLNVDKAIHKTKVDIEIAKKCN